MQKVTALCNNSPTTALLLLYSAIQRCHKMALSGEIMITIVDAYGRRIIGSLEPSRGSLRTAYQ